MQYCLDILFAVLSRGVQLVLTCESVDEIRKRDRSNKSSRPELSCSTARLIFPFKMVFTLQSLLWMK